MISRRMVLAAALAAMGSRAAAQSYPSRAIRMIAPFTPGSPVDVAARLLAQHLGTRLGQNVVVDNRPGAGTTIGMKAATLAEADGYTLLYQSSSLVVAPAIYKNLDYDPLKAFVPVAGVAQGYWVTVVPPSLPVHTMSEFVAYARAHPGKLNFGFGQGTAPQLVGEWLKVTNKLDIGSVPYRGGAQAITDMLAGTIQLNIGTVATLVPLIHDGRLRAISVWGPQRFPQLPDVPTMVESGFPGLSLFFWSGLWAPAGTPAAIVDKLNAATNAALHSPEMKANMEQLGIEPMIGSPQDFAAFIADEAPKWARIVAASGVSVD